MQRKGQLPGDHPRVGGKAAHRAGGVLLEYCLKQPEIDLTRATKAVVAVWCGVVWCGAVRCGVCKWVSEDTLVKAGGSLPPGR